MAHHRVGEFSLAVDHRRVLRLLVILYRPDHHHHRHNSNRCHSFRLHSHESYGYPWLLAVMLDRMPILHLSVVLDEDRSCARIRWIWHRLVVWVMQSMHLTILVYCYLFPPTRTAAESLGYLWTHCRWMFVIHSCQYRRSSPRCARLRFRLMYQLDLFTERSTMKMNWIRIEWMHKKCIKCCLVIFFGNFPQFLWFSFLQKSCIHIMQRTPFAIFIWINLLHLSAIWYRWLDLWIIFGFA